MIAPRNDAPMNNQELDFDLSDDITTLREAVRRFALREIAPIAAQVDRENSFPNMLWPKLGGLGLLGLTCRSRVWRHGTRLPGARRRHGRNNSSLALYWIVLWSTFQSLCEPDSTQWDPHTEAAVSTEVDQWRAHRALAMSEPAAGSDVVGMRLRADHYGDRYVLNGNKMWITNGPDADTVVVYAKTDLNAGAHGITAFIIEKNFKGFRTAQKLDKLGMRGSNTCELVFEDCEVPEDNVLGKIGRGVSVLMSGLDYERVVLSGGPLGIMQACLDLAVPYMRERKQFGKSIGEFQLMQGKMADMYVALSVCRSYAYTVAKACDKGQTTRKDSAGVILYLAEKLRGWRGRRFKLSVVMATLTTILPLVSGGTRSCTRSAQAHLKFAEC